MQASDASISYIPLVSPFFFNTRKKSTAGEINDKVLQFLNSFSCKYRKKFRSKFTCEEMEMRSVAPLLQIANQARTNHGTEIPQQDSYISYHFDLYCLLEALMPIHTVHRSKSAMTNFPRCVLCPFSYFSANHLTHHYILNIYFVSKIS